MARQLSIMEILWRQEEVPEPPQLRPIKKTMKPAANRNVPIQSKCLSQYILLRFSSCLCLSSNCRLSYEISTCLIYADCAPSHLVAQKETAYVWREVEGRPQYESRYIQCKQQPVYTAPPHARMIGDEARRDGGTHARGSIGEDVDHTDSEITMFHRHELADDEVEAELRSCSSGEEHITANLCKVRTTPLIHSHVTAYQGGNILRGGTNHASYDRHNGSPDKEVAATKDVAKTSDRG